MKRASAVGLLVVFAFACLAHSDEKPRPQTQTADDLLREFARRVQTELLPRENLSPTDAQSAAGLIASEVLIPKKDLLFEKVKAELAELPKLSVDLRSGWEVIAVVENGGINREILYQLRQDSASQPTTRATSEGLLLLALWSPRSAALQMRTRILVTRVGPREIGRRTMIDALARVAVYAVDTDIKRPVLAIESGPELVVVHLTRTDGGYYVDEKVEWLKRATAISKPASAESMPK
jgi:hypothetical protein